MALPQHQTLLASIEWSYNPLDEREKTYLSNSPGNGFAVSLTRKPLVKFTSLFFELVTALVFW